MNNLNLVHVSEGSAKMKQIPSVNVSSLQNEFCKKMSKNNDSVCSKCYSNRYARLRPSLEKKLIENSNLLSSVIIHERNLPYFNARYVRFNSFGELINDTHYQNLMKIARKNPHTTFGLWTKRSDIVMKYPKIKNIKYVYSENKIDSLSIKQTELEFFDKVFTVSKSADGINCKGSCIDCLICYTDNELFYIREKLK